MFAFSPFFGGNAFFFDGTNILLYTLLNGADIMYICINLRKSAGLIALPAAAVIFAVPFIGHIPKSVQTDAEPSGVFMPVIMYHSILIEPARQGSYVVSPEQLENDLKWLSDNGWTAVLTDDLIAYTDNGGELPEKPVMITFDDGFYNNMTYALPLLEKYDMKAVISPVGEYCRKSSDSGDINPAYSYLTWDEINELEDSGRIEIGCHTWDMHDTSPRKGCMKKWGESANEYSSALTADITLFNDTIREKCGIETKLFAYPYGYISKESVPVLKSMGFRVTLNCFEKPNYITRDPDCLYSLNRYNRPAYISSEDFFGKIMGD